MRSTGSVAAWVAWAAAILLGAASAARDAAAQPPRPSNPAQTSCVLRVPGMERAVLRTDLPFRASRDTTLRFDLVSPPDRKSGASVPLVVFFNGGGNWNPPLRTWGIYRDWGRLLATRGIASVFTDAVPGRAREDAESLLVHVRRQARSLDIDPDRVALWGCSMHVREGLPFAMEPAHRFRAAALYYGVTDTAVINPDVPVLLARAGLDTPGINDAMGAWAAKAVRLGAPLVWIDLPTLHHAFDAFEDDDLARAVVRQTLDFLEQELSPAGIASRARNADERLALRLARERRWSEVVPVAERWLAQQPDSPNGHLAMANAEYQLKRFDRAATHYRRAGDLGQQPALTWYNAACCLALLGDKQGALELLEKAYATGFIQDRAAAARDPDLASLVGDARFEKLVRP